MSFRHTAWVTAIATVVGLGLATAVQAVGLPSLIQIPSITVRAKIEALGVNRSGVMLAPTSAWTVAWYNKSPRPGNPGNAVMYGHLNTASSKTAVFTHLDQIKPGDLVYVTDAHGTKRAFVVTKTAIYPYNKVPMNELAGPTKSTNLNLYTCAGTWVRRLGNYSHRLVIYTTLWDDGSSS